ncbi:MAG: DUF2911 domain-containing protein [Bacteroidetes bacterium]|nr:MAG: DUF2911 domain-containing protein [Bacteroidota bacterium]
MEIKSIVKQLGAGAIVSGFLCVGMAFGQQLKTPAKSPHATISQDFGLEKVEVSYSRPAMRGRKIFGTELVPYGTVWRTGANESTKIEFGSDVRIFGKELKAGSYSLYTIPGEKEWTIIFNSNTTLWGKNGYKEEEDALRVTAKAMSLKENVESFTIQFSEVSDTRMLMDLSWEKTLVSVEITAEIEEQIMKDIDQIMSNDPRPYYQAASYYYEHGKDLDQALSWANTALEGNPKAFWIALLKAKIQMKKKDYKGAIETAKLSQKLAEERGNQNYVSRAKELIEEAEKQK